MSNPAACFSNTAVALEVDLNHPFSRGSHRHHKHRGASSRTASERSSGRRSNSSSNRRRRWSPRFTPDNPLGGCEPPKNSSTAPEEHHTASQGSHSTARVKPMPTFPTQVPPNLAEMAPTDTSGAFSVNSFSSLFDSDHDQRSSRSSTHSECGSPSPPLNATTAAGGRLFVGSLGAALSLEDALPDTPIRAVVTCLIENNEPLDELLSAEGIPHHYFYVDDVPSTEERAKYSCDKRELLDAITFIDSHLQCDENVFVHCEAGQTRSPGLVCMYLIVCKQWSYTQALAAMQQRQHCQLKPLEPYLRCAARKVACRRLEADHNTDSFCATPPSCSITPMSVDLQLPFGAASSSHHRLANSNNTLSQSFISSSFRDDDGDD